MLSKIKNRVDKSLFVFIEKLNKDYCLSKISPLLHRSIKNFITRPGKRLRPILFVIGYLGFSKREAKNLYISALSIELLHDFMLVHDDIIDKSDLRRGKPAMHAMLSSYIKNKNAKFSGQDLAIVIGDVMYAMAIDAFLSIGEEKSRKETALRAFIQSAIYTGSGEFIELVSGIKGLDEISKKDIDKIYDFKTARYTFAAPITTGAILAGANESEVKKLFTYGIYVGRAFQIKDDILGLFGREKDIGKSATTDLQEAKKTILIWCAYKNSTSADRATIKKVLAKKKISMLDLRKIREIIKKSGSLDYAKKEIFQLSTNAVNALSKLKMKAKYKNLLIQYCNDILSLKP